MNCSKGSCDHELLMREVKILREEKEKLEIENERLAKYQGFSTKIINYCIGKIRNTGELNYIAAMCRFREKQC